MLIAITERKRGGVIGLKKPVDVSDNRRSFRVKQGLLLWRFRDRLKITLFCASEQIGVNEATLCRWESGQGNPSGENLFKLAKLYGCQIQELFPSDS